MTNSFRVFDWISFQRQSSISWTTIVCLVLWASTALADSGFEQITTVKLAEIHSAHWVWVNDASFERIEAGRSALIDGDTGKYLGALTTGVFFMTLALPADYRSIYSVETYYSRGVRGERSDLVRIYNTRTLQPVGEIPIPAKRGVGAPTLFHTSLSDDDRFLFTYFYTPTQSVGVVDLETHKFVGEIETPGCVLAYPDGPRAFHSLCGDGGILFIELDDSGRLKHKSLKKHFFDPGTDPIQEDAVRLGRQWAYVSYDGHVYSLTLEKDQAHFNSPWSLLSEKERSALWRPGGLQLMAAHETKNRLYVLMHKGDEDSQDQAGTEVWVYDFSSNKRVQRIELRIPAMSIQVSRDREPLLFATAGGSELDVYDAISGSHLHTVDHVAAFSTVLQVPWKH